MGYFVTIFIPCSGGGVGFGRVFLPDVWESITQTSPGLLPILWLTNYSLDPSACRSPGALPYFLNAIYTQIEFPGLYLDSIYLVYIEFLGYVGLDMEFNCSNFLYVHMWTCNLMAQIFSRVTSSGQNIM